MTRVLVGSFLGAARASPAVAQLCTLAEPVAEEAAAGTEKQTRLETALFKIQSLPPFGAPPATELDVERRLFQNLAHGVKNGTVATKDLLKGIQDGYLYVGDLRRLVHSEAISPSMHQHIQTTLVRGTSRISVTDVLTLIEHEQLGQREITHMVQNGDLTTEDIGYLVEKKRLPQDVADVVLSETADNQDSRNRWRLGFANIRTKMAKHELEFWKLVPLISTGDLHPDDVELLVLEGVLSQDHAERALEEAASQLYDIYEEVEQFTDLVEKGRFTFEELEVMRAKGVLGDALIHHLVTNGSVGKHQARQLLKIEEDVEYLDREQTDDELEELAVNQDYSLEHAEIAVGQETNLAVADSAEGPEPASDEAQEEKTILEKGGVSNEGFYPEGIDKEDIFSLWEYLMKVYEHHPGDESVVDIPHEETAAGSEKSVSDILSDERKKMLVDPVFDAEGNAIGKGSRKSSVAEVLLKKGRGEIMINERPFQDYFCNLDARCYVISPFLATNTLGLYDATVTVYGGGWSGQSQAIRQGIAQALAAAEPDHQIRLDDLGLLKTDARRVERKKPGKAKARKSFQWVKR